jgi:ribosomal protein S18 acetylase RimI-like enzyme
MKTPEFSPYTFRTATPDDVQAIHDLSVLCDVHDQRFWTGILDDTLQQFNDPDITPATDILLAHTPEGQLVGKIWAFPRTKANRVFLWPEIHPDHRSSGLADILMDWALARANDILARFDASRPRSIRSSTPAHDAWRIDLLKRHDLQPIRYFFEMRRDLSQPIDDGRPPAGLRMVNWSPELDDGAFDAFNDAFQDHWDFTPVSREDWRRYFTGRESFRGDLSFLALDGEKVGAISMNYYSREENERKGVDEAWIGDLGVHRAWRRQGVATALLNRSMRAFKEADIAYASLGVDSESLTGATGVYRRVGFEVVRQSIAFGLNA